MLFFKIYLAVLAPQQPVDCCLFHIFFLPIVVHALLLLSHYPVTSAAIIAATEPQQMPCWLLPFLSKFSLSQHFVAVAGWLRCNSSCCLACHNKQQRE